MWWAIAAVALLVVISVPLWGWRPLARALDDPSAGPWMPVARLGYAADAAGGQLRRLTIATGALFATCALALLGAFLWRVSVDSSLTAAELPSELAAAGVPTWVTIAILGAGVAAASAMRVGLVGQAVIARRDLQVGRGTVAVMVLSAWIWARMVAPAVKTQRDEAERARIAALGPEPAPPSRFSLPLEASADEMSAALPAPTTPDATDVGAPHDAAAGASAPPGSAAPAVALSALPPGARATRARSAAEPLLAAEPPGGDTTGTVPSTAGGVPAGPRESVSAPPIAAPAPGDASRDAERASAASHTGTPLPAVDGAWELVMQDGARLPLRQPQLTVGRGGRGATADVSITDPTRTMSKAHAELRWDGTQWWVRDLGSTNGTHMARQVGSFAPVPRDEHVPVVATLRFGELEATIVPAADRSSA